MTAQEATKIVPITKIKNKRKLTTEEKTQRKEARMNITVDVVDRLRADGTTYHCDYSVFDQYKRHSLNSTSFLFSILSAARPYGSKSCDEFVESLCDIINDLVSASFWCKDDAGNVIVSVGEKNTTLWSSHTDTVHPKHTGYSDLVFDKQYVTSKEKRQLGADDGVGIWLMLNMIEAGVDGLYVFHAGEEVGGIGSTYIAKHTPQLLNNITHAIAFDRKATYSVITHMGFGGRCCSTAFAEDFADKLNIGLVADSTGVYTDTAEYTGLVSECTNISAGYYSEHTFSEYLDYEYAQELLLALLDASNRGDLDTLISERDYNSCYEDYSTDDWWNKFDSCTADDVAVANYGNRYYDNRGGAAFGNAPTMLDIVRSNPIGVVAILKEFGIDAEYLTTYLDI